MRHDNQPNSQEGTLLHDLREDCLQTFYHVNEHSCSVLVAIDIGSLFISCTGVDNLLDDPYTNGVY